MAASTATFGPTASGEFRSTSYHPSLEELPDAIHQASVKDQDPNLRIPIPPGWEFSHPEGQNQLCLSVSKEDANSPRNAFGPGFFAIPSFKFQTNRPPPSPFPTGFVAATRRTDSRDTEIGLQLQIGLNLPFSTT